MTGIGVYGGGGSYTVKVAIYKGNNIQSLADASPLGEGFLRFKCNNDVPVSVFFDVAVPIEADQECPNPNPNPNP